MAKKKKYKFKKKTVVITILIILCLACFFGNDDEAKTEGDVSTEVSEYITAVTETEQVSSSKNSTLPETTKKVNFSIPSNKNVTEPYIEINGNVPDFGKSNLTTKAFEKYSSLDSLGRCGVAYANVCVEIMPTQDRESISSVKPSGWKSVQYDNVDGKSLYNRCHLIGFQLSGENANERNLITGTRYMNVQGMLPFENMVADYVKETNNHVLYRVTPIFEGNNLVASGVQMEAYSVEDDGDGICFNVYCHNIQPGIEIDYSDGSSKLVAVTTTISKGTSKNEYILNTSSKKFHHTWCDSVDNMNEANKQSFTGSREELINQGYSPCGSCKP